MAEIRWRLDDEFDDVIATAAAAEHYRTKAEYVAEATRRKLVADGHLRRKQSATPPRAA